MPSVRPATSKLSHLPLPTLYGLLAPVTVRAGSPRARFTNWGLTYTCNPLAVFEPENELQCSAVLELARREDKTVRVVGLGHSPSDLACTSEFMMRTGRLDKVIEVSAIVYLACLPLFACELSRHPEISSPLMRASFAFARPAPGTLSLSSSRTSATHLCPNRSTITSAMSSHRPASPSALSTPSSPTVVSR